MTATRPDFELRSTAELFDHALIRRRVAKELPDVDPFLQSVAAGLVEQLRERLPAELLDDAGRIVLMVGLSLGGLLGVLAKTDAELPADQLVHVIACAGADLTGEAS